VKRSTKNRKRPPKTRAESSARPEVGQQVAAEELDALKKQVRELAFLHETSQVLTATLDLDQVLQSLMSQVRDYFQVDAVSAALVDVRTGDLVFRVAAGEAAAGIVGMRLAPGQGIAGWVAEKGKPALVPSAREDKRFDPAADDATAFETRAVLAVPIQIEGHTIGIIEALNPASGAYGAEAQRLLCAVAELAGVAIRNAGLHERVRQAERRYESLFHQSADPVVVLDPEGRILDLNRRAEELLDDSRDELIGSSLFRLLGQAEREAVRSLREAREGEQPTRRVRLSTGDGHRFVDAHMARISYGGQEAIQWVGHDATEQVALERTREDLTHMIVHDLRNPLASMMSSLQLIRKSLADREDLRLVREIIAVAIRSGERLHGLTDSLLELGRLEAGEAEPDRIPLEPGTLVQEAVELAQPIALGKRQTIGVQVEPGLPRVLADPALIARVLGNLIDNALKYTPEKGRVTVSVEKAGSEILFAVSDTGPGIDAEMRERVFDRFARLGRVEGVEGIGLGLTFCKLAVVAHGGRIWVDSEPGVGATFRFTLPLPTE
jgi:NtrC-family two-component system sensor histidine kinase KinB